MAKTILQIAQENSGNKRIFTYYPKREKGSPLVNHAYTFNLEFLQSDYYRYVVLSDEEFIRDLPKIIHFAVFVAYYKNLPIEDTLSDTGIIHELVHILHMNHGGLNLLEGKEEHLRNTRKLFNKLLKI